MGVLLYKTGMDERAGNYSIALLNGGGDFHTKRDMDERA